MYRFGVQYGIPLEPVYTGKLVFGLYELISGGYFSRGQIVLALHSGGFQGGVGFSD